MVILHLPLNGHCRIAPESRTRTRSYFVWCLSSLVLFNVLVPVFIVKLRSWSFDECPMFAVCGRQSGLVGRRCTLRFLSGLAALTMVCPVVCSTDRSKAVVPVLVLLLVALWFILRGDLLYVFPYVILFLCFSVLLVLRFPRLGKRELILVLFVRLFGLCLFR